jgi:SAM-dependent methyltransferase
MEGRYAVEVALNYPSNRRFDREHPDFPTPPARLAFDAYANVNHDYYCRTGQERATEIARYVRKYVEVPNPSFLEWGCGCARVLRHLVDELPGSQLTGTDYNAVSIGWCRQNIPGIRFELNDLAPPLPFGDAEFDFVFALSVFTHLSEAMHHAWFEELRRVTKPGGVIALSAHGQNFHPLLVAEEHAMWDRGELIVRNEESEEGKRMFLAFHPERFMREELLAGNEVLEHVTDRGTRKQDFWIVRRP